jgi:hypothetical protein
MRLRSSLAALSALLLSACFHQVVQTGRTPGSTVINKPWTSTFIFGLVPATEINTAAECPGGVATVETLRSFPNGLVGAITFGIYTPVTVKITCASGTASLPGAMRINVREGATTAERVAATNEAIELSLRTGNAVVVTY